MEYYALIIKGVIKDSTAFVHVCACMRVCMWVCACAYACMCACLCMCTHVCMHTEASRIKRSLGQDLSLSLELADLVGWPGSCSELLAVSSPALGFQAGTAAPASVC